MKRLTAILTILCLAFSLCSCSGNKSALKKPVTFYYKLQQQSEDTLSSIMVSELRESYGLDDDYETLLNQYFNGPTTEGYISPFPAGTTLEDFGFIMGRAQIVLSSHLSMLSDYELTLACSCLGRTVLEMTDVKAVQISTTQGLLNGETSITIRKDDFILSDDYCGDQDFEANSEK